MTTQTTLNQQQIEELEEQAISGKWKCFILARKHSHRLPGKHMLKLAGKPIIQYAIEAAQRSDIFEHIIVSSDDEQILELAYELKCRPHKRPETLARSNVPMKEVVKYLGTIYALDNYACLLSGCNPFTMAEDLKAGKKLALDKEANYVMAVTKATKPPQYALEVKNGLIVPRDDLQRSQKYPPMYYNAGSFIFFKHEIFLIEYDFDFHGSNCVPYIVPHHNVDIDTPEDYQYAKFIKGREI